MAERGEKTCTGLGTVRGASTGTLPPANAASDSHDFGHLIRRKAATRGGAPTEVSMVAKKWPL